MQRAICAMASVSSGKKVDTNSLIAMADKAFSDSACLRKTFVCIWQNAFINQSLIGTTLRQMCVAKAGNAIRVISITRSQVSRRLVTV